MKNTPQIWTTQTQDKWHELLWCREHTGIVFSLHKRLEAEKICKLLDDAEAIPYIISENQRNNK